MTTCSARLAAIAVAVFACANSSFANTVAYFDFNSTVSPQTAAVGSGSGTSSTTVASPAPAGSSVNKQSPSTNGNAIGFNGGTANNGAFLTFSIATTGYQSLTLSLAALRSASGYSNDSLQYKGSTDSSFVTFSSFAPPSGTSSTDFGLFTFDLSSITSLNNQSAAMFRIIFDGAVVSSGQDSGTGRIDNLLLSGSPAAVPLPPAAIAGTALLGVVGFLKRRRPVASV